MSKKFEAIIPWRTDLGGRPLNTSDEHFKYFTGECESCEFYRDIMHDGCRVEVCGVTTQPKYLRRSVETRGHLIKDCRVPYKTVGATPVNPSIEHIDEFIKNLRGRKRRTIAHKV